MAINRRKFLSSSVASLALAKGIGAQVHSGREEGSGVSSSARGWTIPRPMFWSFENNDPREQMAGYTFSFQLFTVGQNGTTFSIDAKSIRRGQERNRWTIDASQLSWPGQQLRAQGTLHAEAILEGESVILRVRASASDPIHAIKVTVHDLPKGMVAQTGWQDTPIFEPVTAEGVLHCYPRYTAGMPVWFLGHRSSGIAFSSLDTTLTGKRFCAYAKGDGVQVQLIVEPDARAIGTSFAAPSWEIRRNTTLERAIAARTHLLETTCGLKPWETRSDVPSWARKISLVVTLHGMHWSGFLFHDYAQMLDRVKWVTDRIAGENVLFFLAGWEGRYYRQYGASKPDARMGGVDGLRRLVRGIHAKSAHVMAMFAGNAAGASTPNLDELIKNSGFHGLPGSLDYSPMRGYQVDWAEIRAEGGGRTAWLNPGATGWRDHLLQQISALNEQFDFDGNFFDTQPNTENDFQNNPLDGLKRLADSLRSKRSDLLLATESWFDLSLSIIPCSQTPDGPNRWSARYQRRFAHVSLGEPSRGSTGVHELGYVDYDLPDLLDTFDWPTLAVVDGTLESDPTKAQTVIDAAKRLKG